MTLHATSTDWIYLIRALERGGEVGVDCPAAKASLMAAGLMVPAPAVRRRMYQHGTLMALTKEGAKRAAVVQAQKMGPGYFKHLRKLQNIVVNRNAPEPRRRAYWKAKWHESAA